MRFRRCWLPAFLLASLAATAADVPIKGFPPALTPADLVLRDASIATLDPLQPHAQALAVKDGKIAALGSDEAIAHYIGPHTKVLEVFVGYLRRKLDVAEGQTDPIETVRNVGYRLRLKR